MNHSDATFELLKELTQNEKRYFRIFSSSPGRDKNYLKVFDVLDKMETYDPKLLTQKLSGSINISYEKNYLHKQLQKSLRTFYSGTNSNIELLDILKTIEILFRKRLTVQCQKLIDKGIAIAEKFEQWNYHLELIEWQYRVYGRSGNYKKLSAFENEGMLEKKKLLDNIMDHACVQKEIYSVLLIVNKQSIYAGKIEKAQLQNTISAGLLLLKKHKGTFRIPELIYSTLYLAFHYSGNLKKAYKYARINYEHNNKHPHFKNDIPFRFFVTIGNLVNRCIYLKKYTEGLKYVAELKLFVKHLPAFDAQDIQQEQRSAIFGYETRILVDTQQYAEALKITKEFERTYRHKNLRQNIRLADNLKIARIYFVNGILRESLKQANDLINEKSDGLSLEFLIYAHLMRLCVHYDLKNYSVLEHLSQTAKRFLEKKETNDAFAFSFIEIFRQISKTDTHKKHKFIFTGNLPALKKKVKAPFEYYSDLIKWLEEKK